jgi:hypothetical protein
MVGGEGAHGGGSVRGAGMDDGAREGSEDWISRLTERWKEQLLSSSFFIKLLCISACILKRILKNCIMHFKKVS